MAEAVVDGAMSRFFCHKCSIEIERLLPVSIFIHFLHINTYINKCNNVKSQILYFVLSFCITRKNSFLFAFRSVYEIV